MLYAAMKTICSLSTTGAVCSLRRGLRISPFGQAVSSIRPLFGGRLFPPMTESREERIQGVKKLVAAMKAGNPPIRFRMNTDESVPEIPGSNLKYPIQVHRDVRITAADLELDEVHHKKIFCCTVVTPCLHYASAQMLVEDIDKELVELSVCNCAGDPDKYFYEGRRIAIIEPWYKMRLDLTPGIRVESPAWEIGFDWEDDSD